MSKVVSNIKHSTELEGKEIITRCSYANMYKVPFGDTKEFLGVLNDFINKYKKLPTLTGNYAYIDTRNPLILEAKFYFEEQHNYRSFPAKDKSHDYAGKLIPSNQRKYFKDDSRVIKLIESVDFNNVENVNNIITAYGLGYFVIIDKDLVSYKVVRTDEKQSVLFSYTVVPESEFVFWVQGVAVTTDIPFDFLDNLEDNEETTIDGQQNTIKKVLPWAVLLYFLSK